MVFRLFGHWKTQEHGFFEKLILGGTLFYTLYFESNLQTPQDSAISRWRKRPFSWFRREKPETKKKKFWRRKHVFGGFLKNTGSCSQVEQDHLSLLIFLSLELKYQSFHWNMKIFTVNFSWQISNFVARNYGSLYFDSPTLLPFKIRAFLGFRNRGFLDTWVFWKQVKWLFPFKWHKGWYFFS